MDHRIEKTKRSIYNAFIGIRSKKPLEKITVKELCEMAQINKSTFYAHYNDVYDLSDTIEGEIISAVIKNLEATKDLFDAPQEFTHGLFMAYTSQDALITTVFSGSRSEQFPRKVEATLKDMLCRKYPDLADNIEMNVILTYSVYGGYFAYREYAKHTPEKAMAIIEEVSKRLIQHSSVE